MKRFFLFIALMCLLSGCAAASADSTPAQATASAEASEPIPTQAVSPSPELPDWQSIYRSFISAGEDIPEALNYGVYGVGLADLDLDGTPELFLFDSGASAASGVNFFDIDADGKVICVSAASEYHGEFTPVSVYANGSADFHLLERDNGTKMFYCISGNGSDTFRYEAYIAFGRGELLELRELTFMQEEYDDVSYDLVSSQYRVNGEEATQEQLDSALSGLLEGASQSNYKVTAILLWDTDYEINSEGAADMFDDAVKAYLPID